MLFFVNSSVDFALLQLVILKIGHELNGIKRNEVQLM